jgi:hypothetical protein
MDLEKQNEMLKLYIKQMNEIKRRLFVIDKFLKIENDDYSIQRNIENIALQIRIILELISLGSLILNKEKYNEMYNRYSRDWNARCIIKDIERVNPEFYPTALYQKDLSRPFGKGEVDKKVSGYLTKKNFIKFYEIMNGALHARNPYLHEIDYKVFKEKEICCLREIIELLDLHSIQIFEGFLFLIKMDIWENKPVSGFILEENK